MCYPNGQRFTWFAGHETLFSDGVHLAQSSVDQHLDTNALAQIVGQLKEWGEPRPELLQIPDVIGVKRDRHSTETSSVRLSTPEDDFARSRIIHLGLGKEGSMTRGALTQMRGDTTVVYR